MEIRKNSGTLALTGVFAAIAASLCCIVPVLAILGGLSGIATAFAWAEPFRPYLIGLTVAVLGYAWYLTSRSVTEDDCSCETANQKPAFWQSRKFLTVLTVFAGIMLAFPYYSGIFYQESSAMVVPLQQDGVKEIYLSVEGMTCSGCEQHVEGKVSTLEGIIKVDASYDKGNTVVRYDSTAIAEKEIVKAINSTGYKVIDRHE